VDGVTAFNELGEVAFRLCYLFFHRLGSFVGQVVHPIFFRPGSVPQIPADSRNEDEKSRNSPTKIILTGSRFESESCLKCFATPIESVPDAPDGPSLIDLLLKR